jgi:hypothetical protein
VGRVQAIAVPGRLRSTHDGARRITDGSSFVSQQRDAAHEQRPSFRSRKYRGIAALAISGEALKKAGFEAWNRLKSAAWAAPWRSSSARLDADLRGDPACVAVTAEGDRSRHTATGRQGPLY